MYEYNAIITNVVDGDTADADVDLGMHIHAHVRLRFLNVDTPEKFGVEKELGLIVKDWAVKKILNKNVIIRTKKEDSFGRWLAEVYLPEDGRTIDAIYSSLGVNKYDSSYSVDNVFKLRNGI